MVIGCGHMLRGDDAVGPILIRHLWNDGVPDGVTIVDGGTAGMDVAFKMRGARHVILVDAATTGAEPGTIYRVPGRARSNTCPRSTGSTRTSSVGITRSRSGTGCSVTTTRWSSPCS